MEKVTHQLVLFVVLLINAIVGGCFSSMVSLETRRPFEIHSEFLQPSVELASIQNNDTYSYVTHHVIDNDRYYGVEATLDVYGHTLQTGQLSAGGIWIKSIGGDGQSINGIASGWHISPDLYKDSRTHFYVGWGIRGSPSKGCINMICDGFQKTSSSIAPGDVINPVSSINGSKQYITVRLSKDKSSGDWHVYYGVNSSPQPVGYFPKSLLPGMIDKPVELRFGGYVSHDKPTPSPPMGNGYAPLSGTSASVSSLKLIDADGNENIVNTNLPFEETRPDCYPISYIDSGRFFYGGPGCTE